MKYQYLVDTTTTTMENNNIKQGLCHVETSEGTWKEDRAICHFLDQFTIQLCTTIDFFSNKFIEILL